LIPKGFELISVQIENHGSLLRKEELIGKAERIRLLKKGVADNFLLCNAGASITK